MKLKHMIIAALLTAIGIVIPMIFPKIIIPPAASFTLASHVPIFLAMLFSVWMALAVALGTTLGFLLSGMTIVVVLRAFSHVVFAFFGALYLKKHPLSSKKQAALFALCLSIIHALGELVVVSLLYFKGGLSEAMYAGGYLKSVLVLVGAGTVVHSCIDFWLTMLLTGPLYKMKVGLTGIAASYFTKSSKENADV